VSSKLRTVVIWFVLLGALFGLMFALRPAAGPDHVLTVQAFEDEAVAGHVAAIEVGDDALVVTPSDGSEAYRVVGYVDEDWLWDLPKSGIRVTYAEKSWSFASLAVTLVPLALLLAALVYFVRRSRAGTSSIMEVRKSRARRLAPGTETLRFSDVGGAAEAKERLRDVVDFLQHPKRWTDAGVRPPRGVLLEGPPGCGKTLLARAVAGEAGVPVFVVSASEFVEMFVGVGAARIRDLFETAVKAAPAVIFIDELDAVGRRRGSGIGAGHDEREQTLNQLLVNLDGFERNPRVVVIAATNRADVLDRALLRPGRFDLRIPVMPLGDAERRETLAIHTRGKQLGPDVSLPALAARTAGWSGADLEHLANEATMAAMRRTRGQAGAPVATQADFEKVLDARDARERRFDRLDQMVLESASQLAQPTGPVVVHLTLLDGTDLEGTLIWADATFLKLLPTGGEARIVPKRQVRALRALAGTGDVDVGEAVGDVWANRTPDLA
jgi:cell division protease FtsH